MKMGKKILAAVMLALPLNLAACGNEPNRPRYDEAFVINMIDKLQSENAQTRYYAVHALAEVRCTAARKAVPALRLMLHDENPYVRTEAMRALRKIDPCALAAGSSL